MALYNPITGTLYTSLSNGDGTFAYSEQTSAENAGYTFVGLSDITGDGDADLIVYNASNAQGFVGLSNGDGTFRFQALLWAAGYGAIALGGINGDGKNDVALYDSATGTLYTGLSNGNGSFSFTDQTAAEAVGYTFVGLGDCSGNGKADLILYNASPNAQSFIGLSNGDGTFQYGAGQFWGAGTILARF